MRAAPAVSRAMCIKKCAHGIQVRRKHSGLPRAMALRLIRDRPGDRLSCHHHHWKLRFRQLDASTGASDPNDFAVRKCRARQSQPHVHRIPPRVRDDRDRPSCCRETGGVRRLICPTLQRKYFCVRVWTDFGDLPVVPICRRTCETIALAPEAKHSGHQVRCSGSRTIFPITLRLSMLRSASANFAKGSARSTGARIFPLS